MTEYVVLMKNANEQGWQHVNLIKARSGPAAIRATFQGHHEQGADFTGAEWVAVPARSWKPVTVKVETKTALRFS